MGPSSLTLLILFLYALSTMTYCLQSEISGTVLRPIYEIGDLNGLHLNICAKIVSGILMPGVKDASGKIVSFRGYTVYLLDWLSRLGNFTFDYIFDVPDGETFNSFITAQNCDMYVKGNAYQEIDRYYYLHPYLHVELRMLIPMPEPLSMNLDAVWKPFQPYVWLVLIIVAIPMTAIGLALVDYKESGADAGDFKFFLKAYLQYTLRIILSQGGNSIPNIKWKLRLAVGAWLLAAFVLINAYSSVLFSFIVAPHFKQLIDNVQDLAEISDVNPIFVEGNSAEILVMSSPDTVMKQITIKMNKFPENRVPNITTCMGRVKKGRNVCVDSLSQFHVEMKRDYEKTGKCPLYLKNDDIGGWWNAVMVDKSSPMKEAFNKGILRMVEGGFFLKITDILVGNYYHRINVANSLLSGGLSDGNIPLSLVNLTGPFIILLVGYVLAIWVFVLEKIVQFIFNAKKIIIVV